MNQKQTKEINLGYILAVKSGDEESEEGNVGELWATGMWHKVPAWEDDMCWMIDMLKIQANRFLLCVYTWPPTVCEYFT